MPQIAEPEDTMDSNSVQERFALQVRRTPISKVFDAPTPAELDQQIENTTRRAQA
jgi:hypothetical protein